MSPSTATSLFGPRRVRAQAGQPRSTPTWTDQGPDDGRPPPAIEGEIIDPH
jgi:hypothetical protein